MPPKCASSRYGGRSLGKDNDSMTLRSGMLKRGKFIEQEASSRVNPSSSPFKKGGRSLKSCIYVDDEAEVEEDSNIMIDETLQLQSRGKQYFYTLQCNAELSIDMI